MAIKIDTFTELSDTNLNAHTSDSGGGWSGDEVSNLRIIASTDTLKNNFSPSYSLQKAFCGETILSPEYAVEITGKTGVNTGFTSAFFIYIKYVDSSTYYVLDVRWSGTWILYKGTTFLLSGDISSFSTSTWYNIRLQVVNGYVEVCVNNVKAHVTPIVCTISEVGQAGIGIEGSVPEITSFSSYYTPVDYSVSINFSGSTYTEITGDCIRTSINRDIATYEDGLSMGRCELIIDNHERKYSPLNSIGPYYGNLNPNKPLKIGSIYTSSLGAVTSYSIFTGFLDTFTIDPKLGNQTVHIQASDLIKNMNLQTVNMPLKTNINVGSLFTEVLSYSLVPEANRHVHGFNDIIAFAWLRDREPTGIINDLLTYGNYGAYVAGDGVLHIHDRHFNMEGTVVASYNEFFDLSYSRDESDMGNIIRVTGHPRVRSTIVNTIGFISDIITIPANNGKNSFWLEYIDPDTLDSPTPATSVSAPSVSSGTLVANSLPTSLGVDLSSYITVNAAFFADTSINSLINTNNSLMAYLLKYDVKGYSIQEKPPISHVIEVSSSQTAYGKRDYTIESDFISTLQYTQDYTTFLMYEHIDPTDNISITMKNVWPDILQRELGDVVHIVESNTAIAKDVLIKGLSHEISFERGLEHVTTYITKIWGDPEWLVLGHATKGQLDYRKVGF